MPGLLWRTTTPTNTKACVGCFLVNESLNTLLLADFHDHSNESEAAFQII